MLVYVEMNIAQINKCKSIVFFILAIALARKC